MIDTTSQAYLLLCRGEYYFPDVVQTKIKFLKLGLGDAYNWPKDDIQVVRNKFIFYRPIHLIGNEPVYTLMTTVEEQLKYKRLKKNII